MKKHFSFLVVLLVSLQLTAQKERLKIGTYNVRIDVASDTATKSWNFRKAYVAGLIKSEQLDIAGIQELFHQNQENELKSFLNEYSMISKGRDDNMGNSGERLAIIYKRDRFDLIDQGFFFLSETPDQASKGWDAAFNRICLWGKFLDKKNKQYFYVFNTHFDHVGVLARQKSAELITQKIKTIAKDKPVFCLGDFNASPSEKTFYNHMTSAFTDSKTISKKISGSTGTFNGWEFSKNTFPADVLIDYIFTQKVKVYQYRVISVKTEKDSYPSDHFPVIIECNIKSSKK